MNRCAGYPLLGPSQESMCEPPLSYALLGIDIDVQVTIFLGAPRNRCAIHHFPSLSQEPMHKSPFSCALLGIDVQFTIFAVSSGNRCEGKSPSFETPLGIDVQISTFQALLGVDAQVTLFLGPPRNRCASHHFRRHFQEAMSKSPFSEIPLGISVQLSTFQPLLGISSMQRLPFS